ncbi:MAG: 4-(cytidine 5'-diphospho)-2-C-methyl-D-erythritol kinase [Acetivibrionales bacterium]|jgi:4-diphosphocytidyl-2-C-methyl-D-erythritol kinase
MAVLEVPAYAKINLSLDVTGKREDGYHELSTLMQTVELHDMVRIEEIKGEKIYLECNVPGLPVDSSNLAWKAADILMRSTGIRKGLKISIEKRIPLSAGLAGGSADAAAVLRGLNELFSLGLDNAGLRKIGKYLGADVPYCVAGGTMLAGGIGEILTPLPEFSGVDVVIVRPKVKVLTANVFERLKLQDIPRGGRPDTPLLTEALKKRDVGLVAKHMKNVLEHVTIPEYPVVGEAKKRLMAAGALGSVMSGSGPAVFGLFKDSITASAAYEKLSSETAWECFKTRTTGGM